MNKNKNVIITFVIMLVVVAISVFFTMFVLNKSHEKEIEKLNGIITNYQTNNEDLEDMLESLSAKMESMENEDQHETTSVVVESESETEFPKETMPEEIYDPSSDPNFVEPSRLSQEAIDNTEVEYAIDWDEPGAAFVPNLVDEWRIKNNITSGYIYVFDFELKEDMVVITLEWNDTPYLLEEPQPSAFGE